MSPLVTVGLFAFLGVAAALPNGHIIKMDPEIRYSLMPGPDGKLQPVDLWLNVEGLREIARYNPITQNVYHLFTRSNPTVSQPMVMNNELLLGLSFFNPMRRTICILHGQGGSATGDANTVLVPAFLAADDVNVIVVDWSAGASTSNFAAAVINTVISGESVAAFINWINRVTVASAGTYHIVGHNLGGNQAGIIARNVDGDVPYVTALDPSMLGWINNEDRFDSNDGRYTEVIHTNAGQNGFLSDLGDVDFYPNGGSNMPGCDSHGCSHDRSFHYFAESLRTGGFTGTRCASYVTATTGNCFLPGSLRMGGLIPKTGSSGIYYLETNAATPFSRD